MGQEKRDGPVNLSTLASYVVALGVIGGGALTADTRYMKMSEWEQYAGREFREDLRELEVEIRREEDPDIKEFLEEQYEELLDEYCAQYKDKQRWD